MSAWKGSLSSYSGVKKDGDAGLEGNGAGGGEGDPGGCLGVRLSEADERIENRSHDGDKNTLKEADGLWTQEL